MNENSLSQPDLRFPKSRRLLNSSEFSPVFDNASFSVQHSNFLILAKFNTLGHPRLGVIIAKKNVRLAVNRNHLKRLMRETFRNKQHHLPAIDAIVLARRGSDTLSKENTSEILNSLWNRAAKKATKKATEALL